MSEQRKRVEKALREWAEMRVPGTGDPWPAIRGRVTGEGISEEQVGGERVAARPHRRRAWSPPLVPNTPLGWVLAVFSVLIVAAGAYAISGPVGDLLRYGLPGPAGPGVEGHTGSEQPDAELSDLRTEVDQTQTADGARVTLDWAYADERFVVVGLHTQNLDGAQKAEGSDSRSGSVVFVPSLFDDTVGNEAEFPPYMKVTDASGQDFDSVGGGTLLGPSRTRAEGVFDAPEGLQPGRKHHFRLEVPLYKENRIGVPGEEPHAGPFVFDFEIPVRLAPIIELNQKIEAKGITLTLERVVNSPVHPQAVVCFEPPGDEHSWMPWLKAGGGPRQIGNGCWSIGMEAPVEGPSSVTVAYLEGIPQGDSLSGDETFRPKRIRGPWTFEFEAPYQ